MLTQVHLTLRLHRFTLLAVAAMVAAASIAAFIIEANLRAASAPCFDSLPGAAVGGSALAACQAQEDRFRQIDATWASPLMGIFGGIAPVAGLFAGVSLVAREIEERTAAIAWSLAPSRTRWLVCRVGPVAVILLILFSISAVAATELQRARQPYVDPLLSFYDESSRGLDVVAIGFMVFAAAVLVGAIMGRVLPALIVAAALGLVLTVTSFVAEATWIPSQAVMVDETSGNYDGAILLDQFVRLPSGDLVSVLERPFEVDANGNSIWPPAGSTIVNRLVPGSCHPFAEAVDSAGMMAASAGLLILTALVVRRRRPL